MASVLKIQNQDWTPSLREAILYALEMEIHRDAEAQRQGVHRFRDDNLKAPLARMAVVTRDPAAIPSLVQMAGIVSVRAALVEFGRLALPDLIQVVEQGYTYDAFRCLTTLRHMVQVRGLDYFSDVERVQLKNLVALFLSPDAPMMSGDLSKGMVLARASQLASLLDDTEARGWIEAVATNPIAYQSKTGELPTEFDLSRLRIALDGGVMLPEPVPLDAYFEAWRERGEFGFVGQGQ